jgi:hypothetical protein
LVWRANNQIQDHIDSKILFSPFALLCKYFI